VTSKIASLWKKVEESKHKQQQHASKKDGAGVKDKRVWMSRGGKLQQEDDEGGRHNAGGAPPGRLIRSGTYEKLNTDQLAPPASATQQPKEMKARSRSRLSIKLSKFGLTKRRDDDQANGNHSQPAQSPDELDELGNNLPRDALDSGLSNPADAALSVVTAATAAGRSFRSSSSVSSSRGSLAAAVVAPFNYTPNSSSSNGGLERIKSAAQIKRNSSYVSSMGRRQEGVAGDVSPDEEEADRKGKNTPTGAAPSPMVYAGNTSSSVVTLV
jgi:hypothetical protein